MSQEAKWYVINTYSGYENKVTSTIEQAVENRRLHDLILQIVTPMETVIELKDGEEQEVSRKLFPGYVMIKMVLTDESWIIIRNTRGVTGFVGTDTKPIPLTEAEVKQFGIDGYDNGEQTAPVDIIIPYAVKDSVKVITGPMEGSIGVVENIDVDTKIVTVLISMFGRETPVELELASVKPLTD